MSLVVARGRGVWAGTSVFSDLDQLAEGVPVITLHLALHQIPGLSRYFTGSGSGSDLDFSVRHRFTVSFTWCIIWFIFWAETPQTVTPATWVWVCAVILRLNLHSWSVGFGSFCADWSETSAISTISSALAEKCRIIYQFGGFLLGLGVKLIVLKCE